MAFTQHAANTTTISNSPQPIRRRNNARFSRPKHCTHRFSTSAYWEATPAQASKFRKWTAPQLTSHIFSGWHESLMTWFHDSRMDPSHSDRSLDYYLWIINAISSCPISPIRHCLLLIPKSVQKKISHYIYILISSYIPVFVGSCSHLFLVQLLCHPSILSESLCLHPTHGEVQEIQL